MIAAILMWTLSAQGEPAAPPPPEKKGIPLSMSYDSGLWFKSDDDRFQAVLNGRVTVHYRSILDRPDDTPPSAGAARTQPNTFFIRTGRIDLGGLFLKRVEFKVQFDFPTGAPSNSGTAPSAVTGTIQDAWLGWRPSADFGLRVGQMKEPFSQEQTASHRAIDFSERSVLDRLAPGRDLGIAASGKPLGGLLEYEAGVYNGNGRAVIDHNDEKDLAGRIRVTPLQGLRVGLAGTIGKVAAPGTNPADALDFTSTELNVKFLDAGGAGNSVDGMRARQGAEFSWLYDVFGVRAEWARRIDHARTPAGRRRIPVSAYTASLTAILTGEPKPLEAPIVPAGSGGAVEVAARFAAFRADDEIFARGLADPAANANAVRTASLGINWYLTRALRISPDFIVEKYNREIAFSSGRREDLFKGFLLRFQLDF